MTAAPRRAGYAPSQDAGPGPAQYGAAKFQVGPPPGRVGVWANHTGSKSHCTQRSSRADIYFGVTHKCVGGGAAAGPSDSVPGHVQTNGCN